MKVSHSAAAGWPNLVMSSPSRELLGANVHIGPFDTKHQARSGGELQHKKPNRKATL